MEKMFSFVVLLLYIVLPSHSKDIENGIIVGIFPSPYFPTWFPGKLDGYPGDVDLLKSKGSESPQEYSFDAPSTSVVSMAVDVQTESLYYIDVNTRGIFRMNNVSIYMNRTDTTLENIHEGTSYALGHVTFDWISRNIYWTDRYHNWIAMKPVYTNDTLMYTVLHENQIIVPIGLAVDPVEGYLFWTDRMPSGRVERSNLLGEGRKVIISTSVGFPTGMVIERRERRIYWCDLTRYTVETATYDGLDRRVIHRENGQPFVGLATYKNHVCVTEHYHNSILCYGKDGTEVWSGNSLYFQQPYAIAVYDPDLAPEIVRNKCDSLNCSHFCVHTPTVGRCVCKEGYQLKEDNVTCEALHAIAGKGILFTNGTNICLIDVHAITGASHKPLCILSNLNHTRHIQPDTANGIIYFSNSSGQVIKRYDLQTRNMETVAPTGKVSGLFFDWITRDLYWSENDTNTIKVVSVNAAFSNTIMSNVMRVTNLIGNPHNYSLYWMSGEDTYSYLIEGGTMKGDSRYTIVQNRHLKHPVGLYYDEVYSTIYWVDEDELRSARISDGRIENYLSVGKAQSILIYKDYAVWTTNVADIRAASVVSSTVETVIDLTEHGSVTGMCIYDSRLQRQERGPCEDDNGKCEQICIPTSRGASCQCSFGFKIHNDGKRCQSTPRTTQFALVTDNTHHRIYQIPTKDNAISAKSVIALNIPSISFPHGAVYEPKSQYVYWGELVNSQIQRNKLNGQNVTTVYTFAKHIPARLVFDDTTGNLYFTALEKQSASYSSWYRQKLSYIGVLRLSDDPENIKHKVIVADLYEARCLALYPSKGYIFWGDIGIATSNTDKYIGRSLMDGSNQKRIVIDVSAPLGLTVDYKADRLYWADGSTDEIKSSDLDGNDVKLFYTNKGAHFADIALMGQYLYLIGWNSRKITRIDKKSKLEVSWMPDIPELGRLDSIKMYPGDVQPKNDLCRTNNGECSTFCLPTSDGKKCACEDGVQLRDKRFCQNVCSGTIANGRVNRDCVIYPGAVCDYSCIGHLQKNDKIKTIQCLSNASWNVNENTLCTEVRCDRTINSAVYVKGPCGGKIGDLCDYGCRNVRQTKKYSRVVCSSGGFWIPNTDLCKDSVTPVTKRCKNNIVHGNLDRRCSLAVGITCTYTCDTGYITAYHQNSVQCLPTEEWSVPLNKICIPIPQKAEKQVSKEPEQTSAVPAVGGVLGTLIIIIIIVIAVGVIILVRRSGSITLKENKSVKLQGKAVEAYQATDFSSQVKDENSSGFQNPLSKEDRTFVVIDGQ